MLTRYSFLNDPSSFLDRLVRHQLEFFAVVLGGRMRLTLASTKSLTNFKVSLILRRILFEGYYKVILPK